MSTLGQAAATIRIQTDRSGGDISDDDVVWQNFLFQVRDPMAFLASNERFMATKTSKAFPGQVHSTSVVAGGISPVSHGIVVGYASEAEMEKWNDSNATNPEWIAYLAELNLSSNFLGSNLSRTMKAWGPATMKSIVGHQVGLERMRKGQPRVAVGPFASRDPSLPGVDISRGRYFRFPSQPSTRKCKGRRSVSLRTLGAVQNA